MVRYPTSSGSPPRTPVKKKRTTWRDPDPRHNPRALYGAESPQNHSPSLESFDSAEGGVRIIPMSEVRRFVASQSHDFKRLSAISEEFNGPSDPHYVPRETIPGVPKYTADGNKRAQLLDPYEDVFQDPHAPALVDGVYRLNAPRQDTRNGGSLHYGTRSASPESHDPGRTLEEAAQAGGEPGLRKVTAARKEGAMMARYACR
ncbi:hypothetical protein CERZMDRAFT_83221 [Cercospora zeae-maydis SCOH1-5]|uniref:Uncharacterized protein n=1 Tax=Cercospora zeae-maydis SCOH1-5 TaxID=717836 RepID=A0A6A6FM68_9PEZI|nr:hypothetical protein CERZMDRAFT_83221 [Cercospora zeae-maydis SCOH1-5]